MKIPPPPITHASRRAVLSTLFSVAATLPTVPRLASAAVGGGEGRLQVFDVASAELDRRAYRGLILPNGLRVLLASDPASAKAAASMNVRVGYMSDPPDLPGLAHFCEHMLFLGSKSFPDESGFEKVVASSGGSNNAYTAPEDTNYFFDVQGPALPAALPRFAGFFTAPLFTEGATAREVNAIDSEHNKNLQSDYWRFEQLFKLRADQSHPYAKFGTGNRLTLRDGDASAREALLAFHSRYYQAGQMSLALIGPQPLGELQRLATANFGDVPGRVLPAASEAYDRLPPPFAPAANDPQLTLMLPVNDARELKLTWCLPIPEGELDTWIRSKPEDVWALLISNRGAGGLLPLLKKRGFVNGLEASVDEMTNSFILLSVAFDLTEAGLAKWRAVCSMLFSYLRMLRAAGVPPDLLAETVSMAETSFRYAEPADAEAFASAASNNIAYYEPKEWVRGPATATPEAATGVAYMLDGVADPSAALITLAAKSVGRDATLVEPIYGTKYGTVSIKREVEAWKTSAAPAELRPPSPNPFIPRDFELVCRSARGAACVAPAPKDVAPRVIADRPGLRLHYLLDSTFRRPRAFAYFLFRSPIAFASPEASVRSQLYQAMLADSLQDETYQAALAGLGAGVGAEYNGLYITVSGYNARLPELVRLVSAQVKGAPLSPQVFERRRDTLRRTLANFKNRPPVSQASYYRGIGVETPKFSIDDLAAATEGVTLADVRGFQRSLLPEALLEAFIAGNVDTATAEAMVASVQADIPAAAPLPPEQVPRRKVRVLPAGRTLQQFVTPNALEVNSAIEVYVQIGVDEGDEWMLLALLAQLIEQPFYAELRTRQQLGYIVQAGVTETEGVRGLIFSVQSSALPPDLVEIRIDDFLRGFRSTLESMPAAELDGYRDALAAAQLDVDRRLAAQSGRLWNEIVSRRYEYGRPWRSAERIKRATREQLLDFFDRKMAPDSPTGRRLATHVFASARAPRAPASAEGVLSSAPFYPPMLDRYAQRGGAAQPIEL